MDGNNESDPFLRAFKWEDQLQQQILILGLGKDELDEKRWKQ